MGVASIFIALPTPTRIFMCALKVNYVRNFLRNLPLLTLANMGASQIQYLQKFIYIP